MSAVPLAPLGLGEAYWVAENDGFQSRSSLARASGHYRSAIPTRIHAIELPLPSSLAALVLEAAGELSALASHSRSTLGLGAPLIGPMSAILLRTEASSSSQIENLTVGARQLALALVDQSRSSNAELVLKNVRAMERAMKHGQAVTEGEVLAIHEEILRGDTHLSDHAGRYRNQLVWVGGSSVSPRSADFVAPQPELVKPCMGDLVKFMGRDDLPALAQAAVAHAQFETIHPFVDGNGRVGRALVHVMLRSPSLLQGVTAPISAGLLRDPSGYIAALTAYRSGDAGPIIEQFARASIFAARSGRTLIDNLAVEVDTGRSQLAGLRADSTARKILPLLVANPVVTSRFLQAELGASTRAVLAGLHQLQSRGVLTERTGMKRNRVWHHEGILYLLDDYANQIRRG